MERMQASVLLMWAAIAAFLSQNLVISAANFEDQKNFYFPPTVSYSPPSHSSGSSHATPSPSKGSSGGSYGGAPPVSCGKPPSSKGSSYHTPKPSNPTTPNYTPHPSTPSPTYKTPPITVTPPSPQSPPHTCIYWKNHPGLIWAVFGWWGTLGSAFNSPSNIPGFGPHTSLLQALSNTRTDGYGDLYREGTAALLNSMAPNTKFPYTSSQVRDGFVAALSSIEAAAAQGKAFKMANEGKIN